jgi:glycosyltransferase involved in cell wall biosynthesis
MKGLKFSIIIPAYNASRTLKECLDAVYKQSYPDFEAIIVDDRSKDDTIQIAQKYPCKIVKNDKNLGAAKTRNIGAEEAMGDILYFIDSDTIPKPDVLEKLNKHFSGPNSPAAIVGAYVKEIPLKDFYSKFQNFYTFYNHEQCKEGKIHWFWTACGAISREVFFKIGKFDERYTGASAEDMHMGYDLSIAGHEIILDKSIEVTHLHHHSFSSIMKNDLKKSAAWTQLFLEKNRGNKFKHGFTGPRNLISMLSAYMTFLSFPLSLFSCSILLLFFIGIIGFLGANSSFFNFIFKHSDPVFTIKAMIFHFLINIIVPIGITTGIIKFILATKEKKG